MSQLAKTSITETDTQSNSTRRETPLSPPSDIVKNTRSKEMNIGRKTCPAILHQYKSRARTSSGSQPIQYPTTLDMFQNEYPMPVITFCHNYDIGTNDPTLSSGDLRSKTLHPKVPSGHNKYQSPIYEIRIEGLCSANYAPIPEDKQKKFFNLLAPYKDHLRQNKNFLDALHHLRPGLVDGESSNDWFVVSE